MQSLQAGHDRTFVGSGEQMQQCGTCLCSSAEVEDMIACRYSSYAPGATRYRQHSVSFPRTRLPMSAYATPQHAGHPLTHPKENWQEEVIGTKSPVQAPREHPAHPLQDSN